MLVEEMGATLVTIAKDVKIQVEFNPARVGAYRLIGYENRLLRSEDFNDDAKDAGEIGAGHHVTALYELVPAGREGDTPGVDGLEFQGPAAPAARRGESLIVKLRYKRPDGDASKLIKRGVVDEGRRLLGCLRRPQVRRRRGGVRHAPAGLAAQGEPDLWGSAGAGGSERGGGPVGLSPGVPGPGPQGAGAVRMNPARRRGGASPPAPGLIGPAGTASP